MVTVARYARRLSVFYSGVQSLEYIESLAEVVSEAG